MNSNLKILTPVIVLMGLSFSTFSQGKIDIQVLSAVVKDQVIAGAEIIFQKNGETSITAITDNKGRISIPKPFGGIDDANMNIIIKKVGYSSLVAKGPVNGLTYALSPIMEELDGMRVVLSWGASPDDLDSHLSYPDNHIFFRHKTGDDANLDVDDTDSYGPETITIDKKAQGKKYVYAVHNFSNGSELGNTRLSGISNAKVYVYIGNSLVRTYLVPKGSKPGNVWVVFSIDENGAFNDINQINNTTSESIDNFLATFRGDNSFVSNSSVSQTDMQKSKSLNKKGEEAYHAGQLDKSVELYLQAIEFDPNNGQAYSNLGLSYQKLNNEAEAIWANRKAIALANGPNKNTIQASSYFNIARLYENKSQWQDALDNFKTAKTKKENPAYDKGITRMNGKLGQ